MCCTCSVMAGVTVPVSIVITGVTVSVSIVTTGVTGWHEVTTCRQYRPVPVSILTTGVTVWHEASTCRQYSTDLCRAGQWPWGATGTWHPAPRCPDTTAPSPRSHLLHTPGSCSWGCYGTRTACTHDRTQTLCITDSTQPTLPSPPHTRILWLERLRNTYSLHTRHRRCASLTVSSLHSLHPSITQQLFQPIKI